MPKTKQKQRAPQERKKLSLKTTTILLTEAGYKCAIPVCRQILALDMHHVWEVSAGGGDEPDNLIVLCPNCHRLYHRGEISADSIYLYKSMLVSITRAFDTEAIDRLLFLNQCAPDFLVVSGDGLLYFARLLAAGLARAEQKANNNFQLVSYSVNLSRTGKQLITAWQSGNRTELSAMIRGELPSSRPNSHRRLAK